MYFVVLINKIWNFLPNGIRNPKWLYVLVILLIGELHVEHMRTSYKIISQRIELQMNNVTPAELSLMETLCILNTNPLNEIIYSKTDLCTPKVKEFYYERLDSKGPRRP